MSSAINEMKKTLEANVKHNSDTLKTTKLPEVKKAPVKKDVKTFKVGNTKPIGKRFSDLYEKAVEPKAPDISHTKIEKPDVIVRVEVNNNQPLPWESNASVSVETRNMPETFISGTGRPPENKKPLPVVYENRPTVNNQPAVMGVLGTGFRSHGTTIGR